MPSLGGAEIIVILLVALIVFGPSRLPEVGRQVGGALRELRKMQTSVSKELSDAFNVNDVSGDVSGVPVSPTPSYASPLPAQTPAPASLEGDLGEPATPPPNEFEPPSHGSFN